jgi:hypothetical protein
VAYRGKAACLSHRHWCTPIFLFRYRWKWCPWGGCFSGRAPMHRRAHALIPGDLGLFVRVVDGVMGALPAALSEPTHEGDWSLPVAGGMHLHFAPPLTRSPAVCFHHPAESVPSWRWNGWWPQKTSASMRPPILALHYSRGSYKRLVRALQPRRRANRGSPWKGQNPFFIAARSDPRVFFRRPHVTACCSR